MKNSLETDMKRLFGREDKPTAEDCMRLVQKHIPKNFNGWPSLLRKLADYIEAQPGTVLIHPKALSDLIKLSLREDA